MPSLKKWQLFSILFIMLPNMAMAADSASIAGMGIGDGSHFANFDASLKTIAEGFVGAAKIIVCIMTAVAGCQVVFALNDGRKTVWNIILGVGLALNFGSWLYSAYGSFITNTIPEASVSGYEFSIKSSGSLDIMSGFMEYYMQIIVNGARYIQGPVLKLLLILALINASMQLALDLISGDKIKFMIKETLKTGFYIFLITNWIGGMDLMQALSNGFETIGFLASGGSDYKPDSIVQNGIKMFQSVYDSMTFQLNLSTILTLICLITIVVCIFITGLEMFMARIEFWTMALVTIPLLPFGMVKQFNFLSEKAIGAMFNLAIKVCVIAFISGIAAPLLTSLAKKMADSSDISTDISLLFQSVIASLILVLLTKKVPSLVQGLLAGQPSLAGGDMKKMMMTAVQTTANAAGAGRMAVQAANGSKVKAMSEMAKYAFRKNPVTTGYYAGKQDFKNTQGLANKVDLKDNKK